MPALPGDVGSEANSINESGEIAGALRSKSGSQAAIWTNMKPRLQIVGIGNFKGVAEPFLMTPAAGNAIPLPSPVEIGAITFPLVVLLAKARRRRIRA